jgi:hypothetical protein
MRERDGSDDHYARQQHADHHCVLRMLLQPPREAVAMVLRQPREAAAALAYTVRPPFAMRLVPLCLFMLPCTCCFPHLHALSSFSAASPEST